MAFFVRRKWAHLLEKPSTQRIWMTVYSDMMTNLMLFFLMLYGVTRLSSMTQTNLVKGLQDAVRGVKEEQRPQATRVLEEVAKKLEEHVAARGARGESDASYVEVDEKRINLMLGAPVVFESGSAGLVALARETLHPVAQLIKDIPNAIVVEGHTDDIAIQHSSYHSNWELSVARAFAVIDYFIRAEGLDPRRFSAGGYGEFRPLYSNETEDGRQKNRRIEISIVKLE